MRELFHSLSQLRVPDGDNIGEPFSLIPYQKRWLRGVFGDDSVLYGILSLARGGGKTGLLSAIGSDTINPDGFLHKPGFDTILIASSFAQACIGGESIIGMLGDQHGDICAETYRKVHSQNVLVIQNRVTKARLRVVGSDNKRAHGWRANLILCDEPAQWGTKGEALDAAIRTTLGKRRGGRVLYFGTRARRSSHFYERHCQDRDRDTFSLIYKADKTDPPLRKRTWQKANPALRYGLPLADVLKSEARKARHDPARLAAFRALRLNMGVSEVTSSDMLVDPEQWELILTNPVPLPSGRAVWGVDLGGAQAMSSVAACWGNGRLDTISMFGNAYSLEERSLQDGAGTVYIKAEDGGELVVSKQRIPDILELFRLALDRFGEPAAVFLDRWRIDELKDALDKDRAFKWSRIPIVARGQGFKDGGAAMRAWREAIEDRRIFPVKPCMLLTEALSEAVAINDPAGNEKLAKQAEGGRRMRSKDDVVAASLLAVEGGLSPITERAHASVGYGGLI